MLDMDFFKRVNDEHDHLFGSFVLAEVGRIIKDNIRSVDFAARYGGDEFLIVLTEIDREGALSFCERLRKVIEQTRFRHDEHAAKLTASLGFAISASGDRIIDAKSLVRYADQALYDSKKNGRNRVSCKDLSETRGLAHK
jgi:diguanylate cyclase (GGDEF)-like protein